MPLLELFKRSTILITGLTLSAAGIALVTKAGLGTSPISSLPYVTSFIIKLTFGEWTFIINMLMMLAQIAILRRDFPLSQLLQIPMTVLFSAVIDLVMHLCGGFDPVHYSARLALLAFGCVVLGAGIALQITADMVMLSGEGLVRAISLKSGRNFGLVKTVFDLSLVASSIVLSLAVLGRIEGLREGTVLSAMVVGTISRIFIGRFAFLVEAFPQRKKTGNAAVPLRDAD